MSYENISNEVKKIENKIKNEDKIIEVDREVLKILIESYKDSVSFVKKIVNGKF